MSIKSKPIILYIGQLATKRAWIQKIFSCECQADRAIQVGLSFWCHIAVRLWFIGARRFQTARWSYLQDSNAITLTQGCVQYPRRVVTSNTLLPYGISRVQQLRVSQCNGLKNRDGNTWLKYTEGQRNHFKQGWINPDRQVTRTTKFIKVATNICGSSIWRYIQVTLLAPKTLKWFVDFQNMFAPLVIKWAR